MLETSETKRNTGVLVKKLRKQGNCLDMFNSEQGFLSDSLQQTKDYTA
jgi:hypothetical protein